MGGGEQFHMNGITRFLSNDGTYVLAVTFRDNAECVFIKCPYAYTASEGGGTILQRYMDYIYIFLVFVIMVPLFFFRHILYFPLIYEFSLFLSIPLP